MNTDVYRTARPSTARVTVVNARTEPVGVASTVTVDRVHSILRAAEAGDTRPLFGLYRDIVLSHSHLQAEFAKRKLAVLGDPLRLAPFDKTQPADVDATRLVSQQIREHPDWIRACSHLLDSTLYPVAIVEKVFRISADPRFVYELAELVPVPHHLIDFREGVLRLHVVDKPSGRLTGEFAEVDPVRYIVHRGHLLSFPDNFGGPFRSLVFWWLLSALGKDWWTRFLDKYGSPFLVGEYPDGDDQARTLLEQAFAWASRIGGVVVSQGTKVEMRQAAASDSGEAYKTFLDICNREMSKLILGQTLSADAQATGMGSGVADQQGQVRSDIRQFDAMMLSFTLRTQLLAQILQANGLTGRIPNLSWGSISVAEQQAIATVISALAAASIQPTDASLATISEMLGWELQRSPAPAPFPGGGMPGLFSAAEPDDLDRLVSAGAAPLARGIRERYAELRRLLRESTSPAQFQAAARTLLAADRQPIQGLNPTLNTAAAAAFL